MVDAPEKIWAASVTENYGEWQTTTDGLPRPTEYTRSDLVAELAAENERLAGARVKGVEAAREALGELANVKMDLALDEWCRISNTILSALAEPDGEAEPCQFLPTEDGEFNGNTFGNGDDVPFGWITQRAYDHAYTTSDPVQVTILRTESGPGLMPRVPLYTTPPDASAIREALEIPECVLSLCADKITLSFETDEDASGAFETIEAALAGSAE